MSEPLTPEQTLVRPTRVNPAPAALAPVGPVAAPAPLPASGGGESVAQTILRGLARRWRMVVGLGLLAAVAVGGALWVMLPTPQPTATAKLLVYQQNPPTNLPGTQHPDAPLDRQTQLALVRSQLVLNAALNMKGVAGLPVVREQAEPLDWLAKKLAVEYEGPEILKITLALDDPEQAKTLVNAVLDAFLQEVVNKSVAMRAERIRRLDEMAAQAEDQLNRRRVELRQASQGFGGADEKSLAQQQFLASQQLAAAQSDLIKVQSKLRDLKGEDALLKSRITTGARGDPSDALLEKIADEDGRVKATAARVKELDDWIAKTREVADINKVPSGPQKLKDYEDAKKEHAQVRARAKTVALERFRHSTVSELHAQQASVQQQIELQVELEKTLAEEVKRFEGGIKQMRATTLDLRPLELAVKQAEDLVTRIRAAITSLKLEQDAPARVRELERGVITRVDPEKRRMMVSGGGAVAAVAAVLALIGFSEYRLRRVETPDAVSAGLGLRVVGTVPKRPLRWVPWSGADQFEQWAAESISCTRTMLMHAEGLAAHKVIQITSPVSGEGKTTLSCQLAASVAGTGRKTLLVDADLRNPSAHLRFDLPVGPGLCEVLRGEASIHDVVKETHVPGLMMVPAGQWKDETAVALVSTELQGLFDVWRSQYDFVIVDSSPVLPVTDPLLLALHADGVLMALMQGSSRMPLANEAYKRMSALGIRVLGAVVNGTPGRGYGYSAGYFPKA